MITIKQAAERWGKSVSLIRKWIAQGRLEVTKPGRDVLILNEEAPAPAASGTLSEYQRKAWPKKSAGQRAKGRK